MSKYTQLIKQMHTKFGINHEAKPEFTAEEKNFRYLAMLEEVNEYKDASTKEDELDALVDLTVFALGTAERQGYLPVFEKAFELVMQANLKKELGQNGEKRAGFKLDLVKPEGWTAPDLSKLFTMEWKDEGTSVDAILKERGSRYGTYSANAFYIQTLIREFELMPSWKNNPEESQQLVSIVLNKLARVIVGDHTYDDNYIDIIGYCKLAMGYSNHNGLITIPESITETRQIKYIQIRSQELLDSYKYPWNDSPLHDYIECVINSMICYICGTDQDAKNYHLKRIIKLTENIMGVYCK